MLYATGVQAGPQKCYAREHRAENEERKGRGDVRTKKKRVHEARRKWKNGRGGKGERVREKERERERERVALSRRDGRCADVYR